jgi:hypothetical protein
MQHKNMKTASGDDIVLFGIGLNEERLRNFLHTQDTILGGCEIQARRVLIDFAIGRVAILIIQPDISAANLLFVIEKYHLGRNGLSPTLYKAACFNIYLDCIGFYSPFHPSYTKCPQYRWMKMSSDAIRSLKAMVLISAIEILKYAYAKIEMHMNFIEIHDERTERIDWYFGESIETKD